MSELHTVTDLPKLNTLPIIDIAPFLESGNPKERPETAAALHQACLEYGFFYLKISSYVNPSEPEELTRLAREFFASPQEKKDKISLKNQDNARGWFHSICTGMLCRRYVYCCHSMLTPRM